MRKFVSLRTKIKKPSFLLVSRLSKSLANGLKREREKERERERETGFVVAEACRGGKGRRPNRRNNIAEVGSRNAKAAAVTPLPGKIGKAHYAKSQCLMKIAGARVTRGRLAPLLGRRVDGDPRRGESSPRVATAARPNRDAAKRYSDCALSGFADFFPPSFFFFAAATKGGISVTTGQTTAAPPRRPLCKDFCNCLSAPISRSDYSVLRVYNYQTGQNDEFVISYGNFILLYHVVYCTVYI